MLFRTFRFVDVFKSCRKRIKIEKLRRSLSIYCASQYFIDLWRRNGESQWQFLPQK
jgi:hypothetical protein